MGFWIIVVFALLFAIVWLLGPILRGATAARRRSSFDVQVYRDQLAEVETDISRGVLSEDEAKTSHTEVSRRLLAAAAREAREEGDTSAPRAASRALAAVVAVLVVTASVGLYFSLGSPGYSDRPLALRKAQEAAERANRPTQAQIEAIVDIAVNPEADPRLAGLVGQLEEALVDRPDDLQGFTLLASNLGQLGRFADAHVAQRTVIRLKGEDVAAVDYARLAEFLILAADGYVSPEAETALSTTLKADRTNVMARYYSGIALAQGNRPDLTLRLWQALLEEGPEDAPWVVVIRQQIGEVAALAGQPPPRSAGGRGPSAADIAAASELSTEEREDLIREMVKGLSARLASDGGPAEEWARLIRALGVLRETGQASAIWNEARDTFAEDTPALLVLRRAARDARVVN